MDQQPVSPTPAVRPTALPVEASVASSSASAGVLFCLPGVQRKGGQHAQTVRNMFYIAVYILAFGAAMYLGFKGITPWMGLVAGLAAVGLIALGLWLLDRPSAEHRRLAEQSMRPIQPGARIRCEGKPAAVARIVSLDPIEDVLFEPRVFLGVAAVPSHSLRKTVQIAVGILVGVALFASQAYFRKNMGGCAYVYIMLAIGSGLLAGGIIFPTYLRVIPGRLDIMECTFLGRQVLSVRKIDLRTQQVVVDLQQQLVIVGDAADAPKFAFGAVWDRWGFAHAVLQAAVSTHTPPPLPDDELVG